MEWRCKVKGDEKSLRIVSQVPYTVPLKFTGTYYVREIELILHAPSRLPLVSSRPRL